MARNWTCQKGVRATIILLAIMIVLLASAVAWHNTRPTMSALCADMNDSLGLYRDAPVTIMGIKVGAVRSVRPEGDHVRVDMDIKKRPLSADVQAVVVNNSILTDRRVELVNSQLTGGAQFSYSSCITRANTATPININDSLQAFDNVAKQLASTSQDGSMPLKGVLDKLAHELDASGPTLNSSVNELGELMSSPDQFVGQLRQILDNSDRLTSLTAQEWPNIKTLAPTLTTVFEAAGQLLGLFPGLLQSVGTTSAGPLQRLFTEHLPYLNPILDRSVPIIDLVANHVTSGQQILGKVPAVVSLLRNMFDRQQGALRVTYRPPDFSVSAVSPASVCRQLNSIRENSCDVTSNSRATIPLVQMVLSAIGGSS
ncbi:MlaD family protein [Jongsikchunia kroppenstedtii]|uniref:MlaD family protein n=1 Tax=Jongsikchunia kroppenstedtii TaxID=1121721 RepID=UPI0009DA647A|nr:MlaD family protein [Jongsikchunia kroppenstedtii]